MSVPFPLNIEFQKQGKTKHIQTLMHHPHSYRFKTSRVAYFLLMQCCLLCGRPFIDERALLAPCQGIEGRLLGTFCRTCWFLEEVARLLRTCEDASVRGLATELLAETYELLAAQARASASHDATRGSHEPSSAWSRQGARSRSRSRRGAGAGGPAFR